jgi:hypothetical protein
VTFQDTSQALAGETLDVEPPRTPEEEEETEPENATATSNPTSTSTATPTATPSPAPSPNATPAFSLSRAVPGGSAGATSQPPAALYGAVGVRFAADLATTFTRAFPQAASADAIWSAVPFGSAGTAEVTLLLDESGHLAQTSITGSPSAALRHGIERTLVLLGPRAFTSSGPRVRLRVLARVTRDDIHDGLHGDVFALSGGSFSGEVGTAFFALPPAAGPGRRIDVELRLLP